MGRTYSVFFFIVLLSCLWKDAVITLVFLKCDSNTKNAFQNYSIYFLYIIFFRISVSNVIRAITKDEINTKMQNKANHLPSKKKKKENPPPKKKKKKKKKKS